MLIKQIYKFLQYFELVADVYKRIPAVQLDATSKCLTLFCTVFTKVYWKNGSLFVGGLPRSLVV